MLLAMLAPVRSLLSRPELDGITDGVLEYVFWDLWRGNNPMQDGRAGLKRQVRAAVRGVRSVMHVRDRC